MSVFSRTCGFRSTCRDHAAGLFPARPARLRRQVDSRATSDDGVLSLRSALQGSVSPAYQEGAAFLRELQFDNPAEIARVLDIAMNPNSLFVTYRDKKRSVNANARALSVEGDMRPVVEFLRSQGASGDGLRHVITEHPPVLCYSVDERLAPFFEYLRSVGIADPMEVVENRPSLLGLDVDNNLRKIVGYLQANDYSMEDIVRYLATTI